MWLCHEMEGDYSKLAAVECRPSLREKGKTRIAASRSRGEVGTSRAAQARCQLPGLLD